MKKNYEENFDNIHLLGHISCGQHQKKLRAAIDYFKKTIDPKLRECQHRKIYVNIEEKYSRKGHTQSSK